MNDSIIRFLRQQTCVTICCTDEGGNPYCFSCFYEFNSAERLLYFKSSADAKHSFFLKENSGVAGTILPDKLNKMMIKGIQLQGEILGHHHSLANDSSSNYHKKHPLAMAIKGEVFTILLTDVKMTDRSFGLGKKISWKRNG